MCRCHEPSGTYCVVHDHETAWPKAGDTKRLIREDPREACYEDCFQLGYMGRGIPQLLREFEVVQTVRQRPVVTRPFEDAWLSGAEWRGRDRVYYRHRAARAARPRRRRRGFLRRLFG